MNIKSPPLARPPVAWPRRHSSPAAVAVGLSIRHPRTTRPPARPTTSRRTSPRTAASRGRLITARTFEYLGSYAVATKPDKPVDEMHVVYARPRTSGRIAGTASSRTVRSLVKEVTPVGSEKLTTGQSHWATDIKLWFVMIKDAKGRFPGNDLWGDGWGWALFVAKEPAAQRGDRLLDRLQDVPRPGQEGRLGVRPRIPCTREGPPGQMNRESNTTDKELLIPRCQRRTTLSFLVTTPGWEPSLGGFPALSAMPGQSLLKDVVLLGVALSSAGEALEAVRRRGALVAATTQGAVHND